MTTAKHALSASPYNQELWIARAFYMFGFAWKEKSNMIQWGGNQVRAANLQQTERLNPKNDFLFKRLFGEEEGNRF
ncbi:hypothetical protein [Paenibacillus dendritiformis]|uniref:hypothetical protein n=1 Tax=Paenibacillus dendritiformis TaxID=130049 RepID=UPI000DA708AD|nr:hypothetical protein [Paenibacillus dendritiformis]PZM63106.1 hypothetical protein DOE73_23885 [Paenibacillus dendritiformis]